MQIHVENQNHFKFIQYLHLIIQLYYLLKVIVLIIIILFILIQYFHFRLNLIFLFLNYLKVKI